MVILLYSFSVILGGNFYLGLEEKLKTFKWKDGSLIHYSHTSYMLAYKGILSILPF